MNSQFRIKTLSFAVQSILIYGGVMHFAWATEQDQVTDTATLATISSKATISDQTEGTGSFKANKSKSSSKLNLSLKETPQSVSVVTQEQIEQRNLVSIDDVLAATPGVTVSKQDSERSSYYARGFSITNRQIDGMPVGDNSPRADSFFFDRVEVIKGASGLTGSTGNPSATINMVRKRPDKDFFRECKFNLWKLE